MNVSKLEFVKSYRAYDQILVHAEQKRRKCKDRYATEEEVWVWMADSSGFDWRWQRRRRGISLGLRVGGTLVGGWWMVG